MDIKTNGFSITSYDSEVTISQSDYGKDITISYVELPLFIEQLNIILAIHQPAKEVS